MVGPLSYIGGKNRLSKQIIEIFPEHKTYVEAFAGGAQVLFHKEASKVEVLNDLDEEIVNFFRVCQLILSCRNVFGLFELHKADWSQGHGNQCEVHGPNVFHEVF
jgi:site-specific DNA-adenine methylase